MRANTGSDDGRLLPARLRRPAAVLALGCAVVFLVLAVRYHGAGVPGGFDRWVQDTLPRVGYPRRGFARTTDFAPVAFFVLDAVAAVALLLARRWPLAALAVIGPGLTMLVAEVAKPLIGRTLKGALSMPSGHTAAVTTVGFVGALLLVQRMRARAVLGATIGLLVATLLSTAMAAALVVLGWHFATDTVAGYCLAIATTLAAAFAVEAVAQRRAGSGAAGQTAGSPTRVAQPSDRRPG